eukprot:NODE_4885_length_1005_cov_127.723356_g4678_i0.p1 GENE.NODE_4885_length_1005_cov_127.723356_g4678_i0~~NODE_4885_length_1005_cov_127.723356_g4678_i0.p1  ORF type:complete len:281 (+),score=28.07 NODE_4885_length_1005_cov_127.723356_g4678_i0:81-923(+)
MEAEQFQQLVRDVTMKLFMLNQKTPPTPELLDKFTQFLTDSPLEDVRAALKRYLTVLPIDPPEETMSLVDQVLNEELAQLDVVDACSLVTNGCKAVVWKGDITTLKVDAIVNAANAGLLGCCKPNHPCIDNAIHCRAGPRLRQACRVHRAAQDMEPEQTGICKLTPGFCLPCKYVLHTVGPIIRKREPVTEEATQLLQSCYVECLNSARDAGARSVAFCCISTGVFGYPQEPAAEVALATVRDWLADAGNANAMDFVVFNVFLDKDLDIYTQLMPKYFTP